VGRWPPLVGPCDNCGMATDARGDGRMSVPRFQAKLTNPYNARPTWPANLHRDLDRAVWAAYGWPEDPAETGDEAILARLLALNPARAGAASATAAAS
jgi:hypothetical protein